MSLTQIENEALRLTERERAVLAEHLLSSLGEDATGINEDLWIEEAERRYQEYRDGRLTVRPAEEVFHDAFRALK